MTRSAGRPSQPTPGNREQRCDAVGAPLERTLGATLEHSRDEQFEALYSRYYTPILRYLCGLLRDPEQAEDAAQETFLRAWRHLGALPSNGNLPSWLYRVAKNHGLDLLRHRSLIAWQSLQDVVGEGDGQGQAYRTVETTLLLQQAFDLLAPRHQRVLRLWGGECSVAQMAALLDTTAGTAKNRLSLARRAWWLSYAALTADNQF